MGITAYLMHDRGAKTSERVAWIETGNMRTDDIFKAAKVMAWTDKHRAELRAAYRAENNMEPSAAGQKPSAGNVLHQCLAWALGEKPTQEHQCEAVKDYLKAQGLDTHQYYVVGHSDTDHVHVHIVSNLVNPETGKIHELSFAKRNAQKWALGYERKHGLHCHVREENAAKYEQGKSTKYRDEKQDYATRVTRAYHASDSGKAFIQSLKEEGLTLCAARRGSGFVIVDKRGDIQKLVRQLDIDEKGRAKTEAINKKLGDLDRAKLADADKLAAQRRAEFEQKSQRCEEAKTAAAKEAKRATQQVRKPEVAENTAPPLYKTIDRDRERAREENNKRLGEIENIKAHYKLDARKAELTAARADLAKKQGFLSWILGHKRAAEEHAQATRLNYEDAQRKQQQEIDAINRKYRTPEPGTLRPGVKSEGVRLTKEYEKTGARPKPAQRQDKANHDNPLPELGKMRTVAEIQDAVKKQGWQEPEKDIFSGLRPELQNDAREAYRQAKADEIKRNEEQQESIGQKRGPRLGRD